MQWTSPPIPGAPKPPPVHEPQPVEEDVPEPDSDAGEGGLSGEGESDSDDGEAQSGSAPDEDESEGSSELSDACDCSDCADDSECSDRSGSESDCSSASEDEDLSDRSDSDSDWTGQSDEPEAEDTQTESREKPLRFAVPTVPAYTEHEWVIIPILLSILFAVYATKFIPTGSSDLSEVHRTPFSTPSNFAEFKTRLMDGFLTPRHLTSSFIPGCRVSMTACESNPELIGSGPYYLREKFFGLYSNSTKTATLSGCVAAAKFIHRTCDNLSTFTSKYIQASAVQYELPRILNFCVQ